MLKIILLISFLVSFASADYLYHAQNICIKSYYFQNQKLYFIVSSSGTLSFVNTSNLGDDIFPDYEYNATDNTCYKTPFNNSLKIENFQFNFMMGLTGLICGLLVAISSLMLLKRGTE